MTDPFVQKFNNANNNDKLQICREIITDIKNESVLNNLHIDNFYEYYKNMENMYESANNFYSNFLRLPLNMKYLHVFYTDDNEEYNILIGNYENIRLSLNINDIFYKNRGTYGEKYDKSYIDYITGYINRNGKHSVRDISLKINKTKPNIRYNLTRDIISDQLLNNINYINHFHYDYRVNPVLENILENFNNNIYYYIKIIDIRLQLKNILYNILRYLKYEIPHIGFPNEYWLINSFRTGYHSDPTIENNIISDQNILPNVPVDDRVDPDMTLYQQNNVTSIDQPGRIRRIFDKVNAYIMGMYCKDLTISRCENLIFRVPYLLDPGKPEHQNIKWPFIINARYGIPLQGLDEDNFTLGYKSCKDNFPAHSELVNISEDIKINNNPNYNVLLGFALSDIDAGEKRHKYTEYKFFENYFYKLITGRSHNSQSKIGTYMYRKYSPININDFNNGFIDDPMNQTCNNVFYSKYNINANARIDDLAKKRLFLNILYIVSNRSPRIAHDFSIDNIVLNNPNFVSHNGTPGNTVSNEYIGSILSFCIENYDNFFKRKDYFLRYYTLGDRGHDWFRSILEIIANQSLRFVCTIFNIDDQDDEFYFVRNYSNFRTKIYDSYWAYNDPINNLAYDGEEINKNSDNSINTVFSMCQFIINVLIKCPPNYASPSYTIYKTIIKCVLLCIKNRLGIQNDYIFYLYMLWVYVYTPNMPNNQNLDNINKRNAILHALGTAINYKFANAGYPALNNMVYPQNMDINNIIRNAVVLAGLNFGDMDYNMLYQQTQEVSVDMDFRISCPVINLTFVNDCQNFGVGNLDIIWNIIFRVKMYNHLQSRVLNTVCYDIYEILR